MAGQQIDSLTIMLPISRGVQGLVRSLFSVATTPTRSPRLLRQHLRPLQLVRLAMFLAMLLPAIFAPRPKFLHLRKQSAIEKPVRPIEHMFSLMFLLEFSPGSFFSLSQKASRITTITTTASDRSAYHVTIYLATLAPVLIIRPLQLKKALVTG